MRHREVTGRTGRPRAVLAGVLVGLLALPALPAAVAAQEPPPDPPPPGADEPGPDEGADATPPPADEGGDPGPPPDDEGLGIDDRERLAVARATGDDVTLLVAADDGRVDDAARQLRALGAEVEVVDDDIDYLKATLPPEDAAAAAKAPAVQAVDVDGLIERDDPVPAGAVAPNPQTPPGPDTPPVNPYLPSGDIGAPQFVAANPTYDGRGTVVAIIDSGVDLDSAALSATTTSGQPKIVDWFNANSPTSGDGTWVDATGRHNGPLTVDGETWTTPTTDGPYAFGTLRENQGDLASGELGGDIDRDGTPGETYGVIQDRATLEIYVDLDQDRDFTDETAMTDFTDGNRDVGWFGTDVPGTAVHERVAFVVGTHRSNDDSASSAASWVSIGIAGARHGTHVAGIAAGNDLFGGAFDGVAPGAQVMSIKACLTTTSCTASGILDGIVYGAQNGADVANMSIGGLQALNDGNNARDELIDRTIDEYDMQLVLSAGNDGAGANSVGEPAAATTALTVGASITDDTWRSNYGSDSATPLGLIPFSSRGPREDGGFKPDVVAPGSAIATIPRWQAGLPVGGTYALPAGYGMLNGTSMAAPQVAGAAALLVGAYKATHGGARPDPAALRDAIRGSADPIAGVGVHEQGRGLVDVAGAWARLQAGHSPHAITAAVPSGSPLAALLETPGVGVGIYERDGMVAGGPDRTRTYTLTRTSGPAGTVVVPVTWIGNDGTFTAPSHVALARDTPVRLPVTISSATAGAHSAVMVIDDPSTPGTDLATMNAAFVTQPFVDGVATLSGTVPRNGTRHLFIAVPVGTGSLGISLIGGGATPGAGRIRFMRYHPYGTHADPVGSANCYTPDAGGGCATGSPTGRATVSPQTGVWEIVVEAHRTSDTADAPFTVTASIGGASISPRRDFVGEVAVGTPVERTYTVTNGQLPFHGRLVGGSLASTRQLVPTVADGIDQQYPITVTPGATELTARIGSPSDHAADLDLALFDCTSGSCALADQSADGDSDETVSVANPAPGTWIALVQGYSVPAGTTTYDYRDAFTSPSHGSVSVADADADRAAGATWTVPATVTVSSPAAAGRFLTGPLRVVGSDGSVRGTGEVVLLAPGPATTTTLTSTPSPSTAGEQVTLEATVSAGARGTVTFYDGGAALGTAGVVDGGARITTSTLSVGSHGLRADFAGVGAHQDSTSGPTTHVVTAAPASAPEADAGDDQTVDPGETVTLDATGSSHPDEQDLSYAWAQEGGPPVTLTSADTATPTFVAPDAGPLAFRVVVTDPEGDVDSDTVTVTINQAPVADAGADATTDPGATTTLDGSGSSDPDGDTITYSWAQTGGAAVALTGADAAAPSFTAPSTGPLTFELTVSDGSRTATDTVTITLNGAPVADAGDDQIANPGAAVTLDGTGSGDPDGDTVTYQWTQDSGPAIELAGADTAQPTFTAPASGDLAFALVVRDERGLTATDEVVVRVNRVPDADAGSARTVDQGATVTLDATGSTDADSDALTYAWTQDTGPAVPLTGADTATPSFTAPSGPASLVFIVTVTDVHGARDVSAVTITVVPPLTADEEWVVEAYSTFLQRAPDATGLAYWAGRLAAGTPRATVLRSLALSAEATRGPVVTDLYDRLLDRTAGAGERAYWAGRLTSGAAYSWVERHLLASPERYARSGGADAAYVSDLYVRILGREGGETEIAYWVGRLASGARRLHTVDALLNTPEARAVRVAEVAAAALGRPATEDELEDLGAAFAATRDPRTVAMAAFLLRP